MRRYGDTIQVRTTPNGEGGETDRPGSFLWRGRVYLVRGVVGYWHERSSWWTSPAADAVHGDSDSDGADGDGDGDGGTGGGAGAGAASRAALRVEREVWRVEAAAGRSATLGLYDLCHQLGRRGGTVGAGGEDEAWQLLRVAD